jgi:hypothetical protein
MPPKEIEKLLSKTKTKKESESEEESEEEVTLSTVLRGMSRQSAADIRDNPLLWNKNGTFKKEVAEKLMLQCKLQGKNILKGGESKDETIRRLGEQYIQIKGKHHTNRKAFFCYILNIKVENKDVMREVQKIEKEEEELNDQLEGKAKPAGEAPQGAKPEEAGGAATQIHRDPNAGITSKAEDDVTTLKAQIEAHKEELQRLTDDIHSLADARVEHEMEKLSQHAKLENEALRRQLADATVDKEKLRDVQKIMQRLAAENKQLSERIAKPVSTSDVVVDLADNDETLERDDEFESLDDSGILNLRQNDAVKTLDVKESQLKDEQATIKHATTGKNHQPLPYQKYYINLGKHLNRLRIPTHHAGYIQPSKLGGHHNVDVKCGSYFRHIQTDFKMPN